MYNIHPNSWEHLCRTVVCQHVKLIGVEKRSRLDLTESRAHLPGDKAVQGLGHQEEGIREGAKNGHGGNWQLQLDILFNSFTQEFIAVYETVYSCYTNSQLCICKIREYHHILHQVMRDIRYTKALGVL